MRLSVLKISILFVLAILLAGCSTSVPVEMRALMVGTEDIPQEWIIFKESTSEDWGGELYNVAFAYGNEPYSPAVEHQLVVYFDKTAAIKGFEEYKGYIYSPEWMIPPEADFSPSAVEDLFEYKCTELEVDHVLVINCFILQQHGSYISALGVQMGDPLTFEVLNGILQSIDEKINGN